MKKKTNMIKRNSGFIVGCVLAAGASFFAADILITEVLPEQDSAVTILPTSSSVGELEAEKIESRTYETDPFTVTASGNVLKGVETESPKSETEEPQTDENGNPIAADSDGENSSYSDENSSGSGNSYSGESGSYSDGSGSYSDGSYSDGSYSDGSYSDGSYSDGSYSDGSYSDGSYSDGSYSDGSYSDGSNSGSYDSTIEIQDPGNGDYYYDGSYSGGSSSDGSYSDGSYDNSGTSDAWTPDDVIISGICSRYIDVSELYSYGPSTIRLIRNEIFAVNGRIFNSQDLMDYFSQKSWYVPTYSPEDFDANMFYYLNDYEEANLKLILEYEDWLATQ